MSMASDDFMTGYYDPHVVKEKRFNGKVMPFYLDSTYTEKENIVEVERQMTVEKQTIFVRSFFMSDSAKTPTQKLLEIIDRDTEKLTMQN